MMYVKNPRLRQILSLLIPALLIPCVVIIGAVLLDARAHLFVSLAVAILSLLLLVAGFEQKKIGTRRTVLVSVIIALCIVGRIIPFSSRSRHSLCFAPSILAHRQAFMRDRCPRFCPISSSGKAPGHPFRCWPGA